MDRFCSKCGSPLDMNTGRCPNCAVEEIKNEVTMQMPLENAEVQEGAEEVAVVSNETVASQAVAVENEVIPEEVVPETTVEEEKEALPKKKRKSKVLTTILTILLSVFLFANIVLGAVVANVRLSIGEGNLADIAGSTDIYETAKAVGIDIEPEVEEFCNYMKYNHRINIDKEDIDVIINDSTWRVFIAEELDEFLDDMLEGETAKLKLDREDVIEFMEENEDVIDDELSGKWYDRRYEIADWIVGEDGEIEIISSRDLEREIPEVYNVITFAFSDTSLTILMVLAFILMVLMCINSLSQGLRGIGLTFAICGVPLTVAGVVSLVAPKVIGKMLGSVFFGNALAEILAFISIVGIVYMVISAAAFVIRTFVPKR